MTISTPAVTFDWRPTRDAARAQAIHAIAVAKAPAGMVRPDGLQHFERNMGPDGHTLGCFLDTGDMVAYGVLALRSDTVDQLAELLGVAAERFCVLDGASALPQWRGFGLHYEGIEARIGHAATLGLNEIGATVAPENIRSVRGLLKAGLVVRAFARMYGGLARLVVHRDTQASVGPWTCEAKVLITDLDGHQEALAGGLIGHACTPLVDGRWVIEYGRTS